MLDLASLPENVRALIVAQAATIAQQGAELTAHRAWWRRCGCNWPGCAACSSAARPRSSMPRSPS